VNEQSPFHQPNTFQEGVVPVQAFTSRGIAPSTDRRPRLGRPPRVQPQSDGSQSGSPGGIEPTANPTKTPE
jgi:hypothetical protein